MFTYEFNLFTKKDIMVKLNLVQEFAFRFFTTYEKLRLQKNSIIIRHLLILRWVDMYDSD